MKKPVILVALATLAFGFTAQAQTNFQTFYDFGRKHFTTTLEGFHTDKWGNTFFFIDYDYNNRSDNTVVSPSGSYFEIARCLNFWQDSALAPLSLHVEYNGGLGLGFGINSAFLAGVDWFLHSKDFKNTLNLKLLYKQFVQMESKIPMQFTAVWGCQDLFSLKGVRFSGFLDVWSEFDHVVVLSEPQLWYNCGTEHFNIGGEVEFSYNFGGMEGFHVMPCLGWKWVF
ncbi:MAG: DUF5020 family protein [Bacteroidales bacterium]|nr:DUF5020 family protein [Bacteroidales bacterium]